MLAQQAIIMRAMKETKMALETMQAAVEKAAGVQQAAIITLRHLRDQIAEIAKHPSDAIKKELAALANELSQKTDKLAQAIADHADDDETGPAEREGDV
jgi:hypothetical protein